VPQLRRPYLNRAAKVERVISGDVWSLRSPILTCNTLGRLVRVIHKFKETMMSELHGPATSPFLSHCVDIRHTWVVNFSHDPARSRRPPRPPGTPPPGQLNPNEGLSSSLRGEGGSIAPFKVYPHPVISMH